MDLRRREFLLALASMMGQVVLPDFSTSRHLVPGRVARVYVPLSWREDKLKVIYRHDKVGEKIVLAQPARGFLWPYIEFMVAPPDSRMRPGKHEFFLEASDSRRIPIGFFEVSRFWLGC